MGILFPVFQALTLWMWPGNVFIWTQHMQIVLKSTITNFYSKMPQEVAFQDLLTSLFQDTVYFATWIPSSVDLQSTLWFIDDIALINSSSTPSTTHLNCIWHPCFQFSRTSYLEQSSNLSHWSKQSACFPSSTQDTSVHCCFQKQQLTVT